jgi:phenylacetic acid degradation operon negative regulatory protein
MRDETRRPLTARSVIASTLLGVDPPRLPALALVRSGELFGFRESATRTALSRMAGDGEVVADDGHYALAGGLLDRHRRQQQARHPSRPNWDGSWALALVSPGRRPARDRAAFRDAARRLKLSEVREGVWARPDDLDHRNLPADRSVVDPQVTWVRGARPVDVTPFVDAFDLDGWCRTADDLVAEMRGAQPALDARSTGALAPTFETSAAVLRHLVADPVLPVELLPASWPGDELRSAYDRFDQAFKATWRDWYRAFRRR